MAYNPGQDLTQGALQQLLGSYNPQERQQLLARQQGAQQRYLDVLNEPMPDIGPVQRGVADYLQRYAKNPNNAAVNIIGSIGAETARGEEYQQAQQLRRQKAAETESQMAGEALKESDISSRNMASLLGKTATTGIPTAAQLRTVYTSARNEAAQITKDYQFKSAEERSSWIEQQANNAVKNYIQQFAAGVSLPSPIAAMPTTIQEAAGLSPQLFTDPVQAAKDAGIPITSGVRSTDKQAELYAASQQPGYSGPPVAKPGSSKHETGKAIDVGPLTPDQRQWLLDHGYTQPLPGKDPMHWEYKGAGAPTQVAGPGGVPSPALKLPREQAQQKGYGAEEGKGLFEERKAMSDLSGANSKLMGQLNMLEQIYSNPNIPQGQLAEYQQSLRSGLKTLGVEVAPETGITDFAKAIGTSLALTQKNADGKNLLPGAMSNYEDQLLQKMAPTLSLTQEGRLALVQFMKVVAQSNMRIANEATQLSAANRDQLPASWYQRKERVMLEEMAKLKSESDRILKQYEGVK